MNDEIRIQVLPPVYSEADQSRRDELMKALARLDREYRRAIQPYMDAIVEIDIRYPQRMVVIPS